MKTVIEIEATKGKQISYNEISRIMNGLHERLGNDITVKFASDLTHTVEVNK
ncbi:hypothetical protein [Bacillus cereus group sp. TH152-1LC]|uniref:hypothetical protein n=1 Tax=Bacillus cereus group sp. TH152-1LC TaxID=3018060 RepID=UPI0022E5E6FD|nr:hypothetical protein [Bacillus cereus group sp. TH152-1LC]MDA1677027.1 hypothetical protein [Bacillus cereus group sp. TH152-1LC]